MDKEQGARSTKKWPGIVRENKRLSKQARWIVNDLLDDIIYTQNKIAKAEGQLREATAEDPVIAKLMKQPGIGEVTAWVLRAWIGDFSRFKNAKQLSR